MPDLTPIQTEYNGHHFRSRLEARWAVFFDALGVRFEYEAEGYDLNGVWYLPDFWLPEIGCFVEIKPPLDEDGTHLIEGCVRLAIASKRNVLVVYGNPWPGEYSVVLHNHSYYLWTQFEFAPGRDNPTELWLWGYGSGFLCLNPGSRKYDAPDNESPRLTDAYTAARSARFEHGQRGRTL